MCVRCNKFWRRDKNLSFSNSYIRHSLAIQVQFALDYIYIDISYIDSPHIEQRASVPIRVRGFAKHVKKPVFDIYNQNHCVICTVCTANIYMNRKYFILRQYHFQFQLGWNSQQVSSRRFRIQKSHISHYPYHPHITNITCCTQQLTRESSL